MANLTAEAIEKELAPVVDRINRLEYLYERWQDEKEYEDWGEYEKVMMKMVEDLPNIVYNRSWQKPFGLIVRLPRLHCNVLIYVTAKKTGWKVRS